MEIHKYQKIIIPNKLKTDVWEYLNENNIGNRFEFNGNKEQQFVGLVGEIIIKRLFGLDHEFKNGFDGGFDFVYKGLKIDVKTMGRNVDVKDYFVNNFVAHQKQFDCDIYIFCSLNKKTNMQKGTLVLDQDTKRNLFTFDEFGWAEVLAGYRELIDKLLGVINTTLV